MVLFFNYLREHDLLFKVMICVAPYDEINCEAPEEIADEIAQVLYDCMVEAGSYFCTRCKLDADVSRLSLCIEDFEYEGEILARKGDAVNIGEDHFFNVTQNKKWGIAVKNTKGFFDSNGPLPTYWIH